MKFVIFGILSGIVAALGMGGGTVLILMLTLFTDIEQHIIQGTNLIFFIPTSIVAIIMNVRNKTIDYKIAVYIIFFGIFGAILGSILSFKIDNENLKKYFGIFLVVIAIFESFSLFTQYRKNKKENNKNENDKKKGVRVL